MEVKLKKRWRFLQSVISKLSCFCLKVHTQLKWDKLGWYLISIRVFEMGAYILVWSLNNCTINSLSHFEAVQRFCSANRASPSTVGERKGSSISPQRSKLQKRNLPPSRIARTLCQKGGGANATYTATFLPSIVVVFIKALLQYLLGKQVFRCHCLKKGKS